MNAAICDEIPADLSFISDYRVSGVVNEVTGKETVCCPSYGEEKYKISLVDFGAKKSICENLRRRGCKVTVFPATSSAEEILAGDPDGVMLSNGPGDPAENLYQIEQIKKILGKKPIFGICLGHQLTALAAGGKTYKLKFGHRGANQPVKDLFGKRTFITSQNHGYAVDPESVSGVGRVSFINANDGSCEGVDYKSLDCFTVQFHPEASAGPLDTSFLFDRFISMISEKTR
jgi:carbamoyl-phosphate synthase small subunit